jgi:hypothetical protein
MYNPFVTVYTINNTTMHSTHSLTLLLALWIIWKLENIWLHRLLEIIKFWLMLGLWVIMDRHMHRFGLLPVVIIAVLLRMNRLEGECVWFDLDPNDLSTVLHMLNNFIFLSLVGVVTKRWVIDWNHKILSKNSCYSTMNMT